MARPKTAPHYHERVAVYAEQGYKTPTITRLIQEEAEKDGRVDYPSERTVRRLYDGHKAKPEEKRMEYAAFRWPESMDEAGIPWDGSRVVLDFIERWLERRPHRPTFGLVKWYWRVHLAAPGLRYWDRDRLRAAEWLSSGEHHPTNLNEVAARAVESYLAYQPWRWSGDYQEYLDLLERLFRPNNAVPPDWLLQDQDRIRIPSLMAFVMMVTRQHGLFPPPEWEKRRDGSRRRSR